MSKVDKLTQLYCSFITMKLGAMLPENLGSPLEARYVISGALDDIVTETRFPLEKLLDDTVPPDKTDLDDARIYIGCDTLILETPSWPKLASLLFLETTINVHMALLSRLSVGELNSPINMETIKHTLGIGYSL